MTNKYLENWAVKNSTETRRGRTFPRGFVAPPPPPPPPQGGTTNPDYPFSFDNYKVAMRGANSGHYAWPHYFPSYPPKIDNVAALGTTGASATGDYYDRNYNSPDGEGGQYAASGGFFRNRPKPLGVQSGTEATWRTALARMEIAQAKMMGVDGFAIEILGSSGQNWNWGNYIVSGIEQEADPYFQFFWQPDGTAGGTNNMATLATAMRTGMDSPYYFKLPGTNRPLVSPFGPERAPGGTSSNQLSLWTTLKTNLNGTVAPIYDTAFWGYYVADWTTAGQAPTFDALFEKRHGRWGDPMYTGPQSNSNQNGGAVSYGETTFGAGFKWMSYVRAQDYRPKDDGYWEAWNTELFRACWMMAINNRTKITQLIIPTFNDYSEHTEIADSRNCGTSWLRLGAYYNCWWKLGTPPDIDKPTIFLNHRRMSTNVTVSNFTTQTVKAANFTPTSAPSKNDVEALVFAPSACDVIISYNGVDQGTVSVPAGVTSVKKPVPTTNNTTISARMVQSGTTIQSVTSPWSFVTSAAVEDLQYYMVVSR